VIWRRREARATPSQVARVAVDLVPDRYAGLYLDRAGRIVVGLRDGDEALVAQLRAALPGAALDWFPARFSLAELERVHDRVGADRHELAARGVVISVVGVDVPRNAVRVGLADAPADAARILGERYGEAVRVDPGRVVARPSGRERGAGRL